ncbi:MAG: porin [Deltaproteobacteria bacterium]|nr:porin [Deltaproteobacteria bacterium]
MRMRCKRVVWGFPLFVLWAVSSAYAVDGPFVGIDLGYSIPANDNYRAHVHDTGGTANPYAGYMFNHYLGLQGQLHATFQTPDNDHRGFAHENQITTLLGGTVGPRLVLPLGTLVELYGTGQGGVFTGLSGRLNHTAPGFSVGGGIDFNVTPQFAVGVFGRWNRAYMSPRPKDLGPTQVSDQRFGEDVRWATFGVGLKYAFNRPAVAPPPAPPAPPPVAQAPPAKQKIVLRSVHFDFDKATIRRDAVPVLNEAAETLKAEGGIAVIVEGHTDSVGTDAYNQKLSRRRADAVRQYLVKHGIPANRITAEGFGESRPVASNDTADGRAQNRRVELRVE